MVHACASGMLCRMRLRRLRPHWRALFLPCTLVLASSTAWGLGCSSSEESDLGDASSPTDGSTLDTGSPSGDGASGGDEGGSVDAAAKRDCTGDLDADGVWKHLECSGLYASLADKTVASDVHPYKPAAELWSD